MHWFRNTARAPTIDMLQLFFSTLLFGLAACGMQDSNEAVLEKKARAIHDRVLTLDTHIDIPFDFATPAVDPGVRGNFQVDLPKMEEGGLNAGFWIVYVGQTERTTENYAEAKRLALIKFNAIRRMATEMYPDRVELAKTASDVERIHKSGKIAALIGIENGYVIGTDTALLTRYHELGARYITLAHGGHNDIADSATPRDALGDRPAEHGGISAFGEQVIREMNALGVLVDVSHISKDASMDAMRLSEAPVIASHSSTRALRDHPRNMDDEQLLALKANGGVMQTVAFRNYIKQAPAEQIAERDSIRAHYGIERRADVAALPEEDQEAYRTALAALEARWPRVTVQDFVDHIDYAVELIGIDHVGISSDFDGGGGVDGWSHAGETFNVTHELVRRGYTEEEIAKLWSGNLLRVLRTAEMVAAATQK